MSHRTATCMTGGQAVVGTLASQGIERIFGVPGGHSIPLFDALHRQSDVQLVLGRHEQGLVGMQRNFGHSDIGCALTNPDFQKFAAAFGVPAVRVDRIDQFGDVLEEKICSEKLNLIELTVELADP